MALPNPPPGIIERATTGAAGPESVAVNRGGVNYDQATAEEMIRAEKAAREKAEAEAIAKARADEEYLNYQIGRHPGYVEDSANRQRQLGNSFGSEQGGSAQRTVETAYNRGGNLETQGQAVTQYGQGTANEIYDQAGYLRDQGRGVASLGDWAANRGPGATLDFGQQNTALGTAGGNAASLAGLESQQGPSGAQAALQQGANQSMAQSLALSRSGRGFGGSAAAQSGALGQNAATMQQVGNAAAMLKAQEDAAWRARQAANLGTSAGIEQANAAQFGQQQALSADTSLQSRAQNDALQTNLYQLGMGAQKDALGAQTAAGALGVQSAATGADIYGKGVDTELKGEQLAGDIRQSGFEGELKGNIAADAINIAQNDADRAKEAARIEREKIATQRYGIDKGVDIAENQANTQTIGGVVNAGAAIFGSLLDSDERVKTNIQPAFGSGPSNRSDLSPWGKSGQSSYDTAMSQDAAAEARQAEVDMQRRKALIGAAQQTVQAFAAPMINDDSYSQYQKIASLGGFQASDEYSKRLTSEAPSATLEAAEATTPYSYEYTEPERFGGGRQYGIMAQDLEQTPAGAAVVKEAPDGTKMIDTPKLTTQNTASIGELSRRLDALAEDVSGVARPSTRDLDKLQKEKTAELNRAFGRPQNAGDEQTMRELEQLAGEVAGRSYEVPQRQTGRRLTRDEQLMRELDALERAKSLEALSYGEPRQTPRRSLARSRQPVSAPEDSPWT